MGDTEIEAWTETRGKCQKLWAWSEIRVVVRNWRVQSEIRGAHSEM